MSLKIGKLIYLHWKRVSVNVVINVVNRLDSFLVKKTNKTLRFQTCILLNFDLIQLSNIFDLKQYN